MSTEQNGDSTVEGRAPLTSAQKLAASSTSVNEVPADPFGKEAKHFTEIRVLHRDVRLLKHEDLVIFFLSKNVFLLFKFVMYLSIYAIQVRIVLEGVDKFSNLTGSVYYPDGESAKDLSLELIENVSHYIMLIWWSFWFLS